MLEPRNFMDNPLTNPYAVLTYDQPEENKNHVEMSSWNTGLPKDMIGRKVLVTPVQWDTKSHEDDTQASVYGGRNEERPCYESDSFYCDEYFLGFTDKRFRSEKGVIRGMFSRTEWNPETQVFYCKSYVYPWQCFEIKPLHENLIHIFRRKILRLFPPMEV